MNLGMASMTARQMRFSVLASARELDSHCDTPHIVQQAMTSKSTACSTVSTVCRSLLGGAVLTHVSVIVFVCLCADVVCLCACFFRFINQLMRRRPLTVHGDGNNTRNFLYVEDVARAFDCILHKAEVGRVYNIGGTNEYR